MTNPITIDKETMRWLARWVGSPAALLVVVLVLWPLTPYGKRDRDDKPDKAVVADTSWVTLFEQKLEAHGRQADANQRATIDQLVVLESLMREAVDQQRVGNALQRQALQFEKCLTNARNDDARRACTSAIATR